MNKIILVGNLTQDPELQTSSNGTSYCNPTIAVNKLKKEDGADFFRLSVFGNNAENLCKYMGKGNTIAIEGRLQNNNYEKNGEKHYSKEIICDRVEFFGRGKSNNNDEDNAPEGFSKLDEDIPF